MVQKGCSLVSSAHRSLWGREALAKYSKRVFATPLRMLKGELPKGGLRKQGVLWHEWVKVIHCLLGFLSNLWVTVNCF